MIIMRKYKRVLPEVCYGERVGFFSFFFFTGLLHRSHSPRQFACLSESEKEGLSALTPHRGCASYPNRPLLAFKSRAPTSLSYSTWLSCPLTIAPTPSLPVNTPAFARGGKKGGWGRERENPRYYLMRSWSARVLFTVTRHRGPSLQVRRITGLLPHLPPLPL